ncbi:hypothetical protein IH979_00600 [Patescibacteria group bacterium]|nr:hypothetical protein [Patescibacteria group bacterium]
MEKLFSNVKKAKKEGEAITVRVREKAVGYLLAGFGIVAGLAWNEAMKELIEVLYPIDQNSLVAKFIYAAAMTLLVVIASAVFLRFSKKKEEIERRK